jgi:hypothetical protein
MTGIIPMMVPTRTTAFVARSATAIEGRSVVAGTAFTPVIGRTGSLSVRLRFRVPIRVCWLRSIKIFRRSGRFLICRFDLFRWTLGFRSAGVVLSVAVAVVSLAVAAALPFRS